jgi:hypothetical protein
MTRLTFPICAIAITAAFSQDTGTVKAALQQRVGEIKQSIARNQAQLRQYAWTETVEISYKGEDKKRTQNDCFYLPDGKVAKTPIGTPPPPKNRKGLRGKIAANKIDEIKDYMDRVSSLVKRYVPPDPQILEASFQSGKASLNPGSGEVVFCDYFKPGDRVTLDFNTAAKKLTSFVVTTYLDEPKDVVNLNATFSSLPDGTNFLDQSVLAATAKQVQVTTINNGYRKAGG